MLAVFLTVAVSIALSSAQTETFRCDCALFADSQTENCDWKVSAIALYGSYTEIEPYWCTSPEGGDLAHPCKTYCLNWLDDELADGFNFCQNTTETGDRCIGGIMCEVLYNEGITDTLYGDNLALYYRVSECPFAHNTWVDLNRGLQWPLCCNEGYFENCYGLDCDCYKGNNRAYCECGVFVPEQFEGENFLTALPLAFTSSLTAPLVPIGFCLNFGSEEDECRQLCEDSGAGYFNGYRLSDYPPGVTDYTYGQAYCNGFKFEEGDDFQGLNTNLKVYQRGPQCATIGWLEVPGVQHPETLCCQPDGTHVYPCVPNLIDTREN